MPTTKDCINEYQTTKKELQRLIAHKNNLEYLICEPVEKAILASKKYREFNKPHCPRLNIYDVTEDEIEFAFEKDEIGYYDYLRIKIDDIDNLTPINLITQNERDVMDDNDEIKNYEEYQRLRKIFGKEDEEILDTLKRENLKLIGLVRDLRLQKATE